MGPAAQGQEKQIPWITEVALDIFDCYSEIALSCFSFLKIAIPFLWVVLLFEFHLLRVVYETDL